MTTKRKERTTRPDRGRYSRVTRRIWNSPSFQALTHPPPCGGWLWFRLLTGTELTNVPGLFQAWEPGLAAALRWSLKGFREAFAEVSREGLAKADWAVGLVWLPKAIEHNEPESPNVVLSWKLAWSELPDCDLKLEAYSLLEAWAKAKGKAWLEAFGKACPKPSGKPSRKAMANQDQDQDQDLDLLNQPAKDLSGHSPLADDGWLAGDDANEAAEPESEPASQPEPEWEPPSRSAPSGTREAVVVARNRQPRERPRVRPQELPTRVSPRDLPVPSAFGDYATELGLDQQAFADVVLDWREKVPAGTYVRLYDVLGRFIEARAVRKGNAVSGPAKARQSDRPPPQWVPPPEPPPDPNPPPPNPIFNFRARRASNG